ncbi:hypothetical protein GALMADRAFT_236551 [Galerina marginata CBS 339.88]|uniref:INO80 complex subunit F domain-containing protein n=1 Tax=Galerina marginata (strain CBS 339.88) TaxID=685588 RepID=A0A067TVP6_GALM3|nr:hypothetical protein GALMADRAFT_236551 [Galerina marginata CBS 339.88]
MSPVPSPAPPSQSQLSVPQRQKQKPFAIGIAAGAEDAKYQAKYKELKRKVKDIETDNDKLHFKVLQAKLSIRRMKMERAVLYERLSIVPPSPNMQDRLALPPTHPVMSGPPQPSSRPVSGSHQHREMRDHPSSMDPDQVHNLQEHIRPQGNPRVATGPDGRPVPVMDNSMGSAAALSPHMSVNSPRRISGGHDSGRHHLPPMAQLPPVQHQYNSHGSPPLAHAHPSSSHSRNRSHSSSRSRSQNVPPQSYRAPGQQQHHYPESLPPVHHQPMHSPPLSERERPRRGDPHEYVGSHAESHGYDRHPTHLPASPRTHSSEARSSSRIHSHQRLGPGTYITREEYHDKQREQEREREWERERDRNREYSRSREMTSSHMHSPPHSVHRSRSQIDRGDYDPHVPPRSRDEPAYYHDTHAPSGYPRLTRSDTPGSGSASGSGGGVADVPSRPDSRSQYYERDQARAPYRLRPVAQPTEDVDFVHEDGRSQPRADRGAVSGGGGGNFPASEQNQNRPSLDSRKRSRNDMDVDSDNDVGDGPSTGGTLYSSGRLQEDRGSKRYHREHTRRSVDNHHEDSRMGPP